MNKTRFYKIRNLFIVISACLAMSIAEANAQTARLSIHLDKVPIERVVNEIEQQSRYLFLFNKDIDDTRITVSVDATDKTVPGNSAAVIRRYRSRLYHRRYEYSRYQVG